MSDIQLIIDYKNGNIKEVSTQAETQFTKSGEKAGKGFSQSFKEASKSVLGTLSKIGAAASAVGSIALFKSVKDAAQLEVINTQFEVMLKSSSAAQKQVEELQTFAASTPFQLPGLAEATKQLLSFGVAQDDVIPNLQQLGDIAAGVGADITDLTIPFGRLISTQKLTLQELDKFADRGVNIYKELADQTGTSLKTIRDDISKGKIPFEEFSTAITNLTGPTGLFFNGMEKQSQTLTGVLSTLGDNFFNLSANLGKAFSPLIIDLAKGLTSAIQSLSASAKNLNIFEDIIEPMTAFADSVIQNVVRPFEIVYNVAERVGSAISDLFKSIADSLIDFFQPLIDFAVKVGEFVGKAFDATLEKAKEVAQESNEIGFFEGVLEDTSLSDSLAMKNENLRTYFQEQRAIIAEETAATGEMTDESLLKAVEQSQTFGSMLTETFGNVSIGINKTKEEMAKVADQTAKIVKNGLAKGISGGIQNIVTSLAKGEDVFANFGKFLLSTIGDLAIQLGSFFIAEGIAVQALNAVSGTGAIAAGAALVALGSLLKSFSGGGSAGASAGGSGGGASSPSFSSSEPSGEFLEEASAATPSTVVNFNIDGNVKGDEEFIRDTVASIGEEAGKQGLVFDNFATA